MNFRSWIFVLTLAAMTFGIWWVSKDYRPGAEKGQLAPTFQLPDRSGRIHSLQEYQGRAVLLNFWATWCAPCVSEMGSFEKLTQKFKGQPFEIVAVSMDEEGWKAVDAFTKKIPITFTILLDKDFKTADAYGTYRIPETYLVDQKGRIVEKFFGPQEWADPAFVKKIQSLIQKFD